MHVRTQGKSLVSRLARKLFLFWGGGAGNGEGEAISPLFCKEIAAKTTTVTVCVRTAVEQMQMRAEENLEEKMFGNLPERSRTAEAGRKGAEKCILLPGGLLRKLAVSYLRDTVQTGGGGCSKLQRVNGLSW